MLPPRSNRFAVYNLRDLGGHRGLDGRIVRRGRLYRAGRLYRLARGDRTWLASFGLRTVIDLRRPDECAAKGTVTVTPGLTRHAIDLHPTPWAPALPTAQQMPEHLAASYLEIAEAGVTGQNPVGKALTTIADAGTAPLVFHCAAGRDRTGVLAALVLALLGVDDDEIADDYAGEAPASTAAIWIRAACRGELPLNGWALNRTPRGAVLLLLAGLRQRYGSIEAYAEKAGAGGAVLTTMRDHLLGPAPEFPLGRGTS